MRSESQWARRFFANVGRATPHRLTVISRGLYHSSRWAGWGERAGRRSWRRRHVSELRKFSRVPSRLRCWCEGENITVYARIGNLSEGGLFLRTSTPLNEGSRALLRFGNENPIEAQARVVWARLEGQGGPPGMGLVFEGVDADRLETIRRLVQAESQHPGR
ncbi:MAG: TIGR02266 family protein [Archangiaceae bacterium]|nr:TIGR02266 family protein [Archangiaceae bacterium]